MYNQQLLGRFHNLKFQNQIANPDLRGKAINSLCGDEVEVWLKITGQQIVEIGWQGQGCAISQVAVDLLAEQVIGMTFKQVLELQDQGSIKLLNTQLKPSRHKCATLGLKALQNAISEQNQQF